MKIRIYYEDTDSGGIVYHANYLKFCERARSEFCFLNGVKFSDESHFVVSKITANFIKSAHLGDLIFVRTKVEKIGKASMILAQSIEKIGEFENFGGEKFSGEKKFGQNFEENLEKNSEKNFKAENFHGEIIFTAQVTLAFLNGDKIGKIDENLAKIFEKLS